jgi:tetratricopeptide (TPR) repeat protein
VVCRRDATAGKYAQALRVAEAVCRLVPGDADYLNTLGAAQYRAERYQEALATLTRSDQIRATAGKRLRPADLAFLAMAQYRLSKKMEAAATLERLVQAMKAPAYSDYEQAQGLLHEAEALLQAKKTP